MSSVNPRVQVVGRRLDVEHHRLCDFLTRIAQPHEWLEAGSPEAARLLGGRGLLDAPLPVVVNEERTFSGASVEVLAAALGLHGAAEALALRPRGHRRGPRRSRRRRVREQRAPFSDDGAVGMQSNRASPTREG